ncbi:MAG: site-2 protease family protein [Planctomycetota bacterium]
MPMASEDWRGDVHGGGRWRRLARRVFGDGENPLGWGLPLYRAFGISVRVHLLFLVLVAAETIRALLPSGPSWLWVLPIYVALFVLVLLHEYGHCFACRRVGGEADGILMWPLGGLASVAPPHDWKSNLITTAGGPLVNAVLLPVLLLAVFGATGSWASAVFNPSDPGGAIGGLLARDGTQPWWLVWLWAFHYSNLILLAFNVLVPMYPMDGGRMLQAGLWARLGYRESMRISVLVGFGAAGVLAVIGLVAQETTLVLIAVFGGVVCFMERQRLRFEAEAGYGDTLVGLEEARSESDRAAEREAKRAEAAAIKAQTEQIELDRILEKIGTGGMESLSRAEKARLKKATEKRRGG